MFLLYLWPGLYDLMSIGFLGFFSSNKWRLWQLNGQWKWQFHNGLMTFSMDEIASSLLILLRFQHPREVFLCFPLRKMCFKRRSKYEYTIACPNCIIPDHLPASQFTYLWTVISSFFHVGIQMLFLVTIVKTYTE